MIDDIVIPRVYSLLSCFVWALLSFYKYGCLKVSSFSLVWALDDIKGHELHVNLPLLLFFP